MQKTRKQVKKIQQPQSVRPSRWDNSYFIIGMVLLLTVLFYSNSLNNNLLNWDDNAYVTHNEDIRSLSPENIKKFFSQGYVGIYVPVAMLTYAVDYQIYGLNPWGYHFTNLIFHLLNTILVFYLFRLVLKNVRLSGFAALLFALHPMHVESVAWVSERKDLVFAFFFLLSLCFYIRYIKDSKSYLFLLSFLLFVFSCFSKTTAITLSVVICLFDFWCGRKLSWKLVLEKIPFLAISFVFAFISMKTQSSAAAIGDFSQLNLLNRILTIAYSGVYYIIKFVVPSNLCFVHPYPIYGGIYQLSWEYYAAPFLWLAILLWMVFNAKQRKNLILGFGFYFATIGLTINIIPIGMCVVAERYSYIPYIGLTFVIIQLFLSLKNGTRKKAVGIIAVLACIVFGFQTYNRNKDWKDTKSIARDGIKKYPDNFFPYDKTGDEFSKLGEGSIEEMKEALFYFNKSLELYPDNPRTYDNRGKVKGMLGDYTGSIEDFNIAIAQYRKRDNDKNKIVSKNSGSSLTYFNRALSKKAIGDFVGAELDLDTALHIKENYIPAKIALQEVTFHSKKYQKSVDAGNDILQDTIFAGAYFFKGNSLFYLNRIPEALENFDKAIELNDSEPNYFTNRGLVLKSINRKEDACSDFQAAYKLGNTALENEIRNCGK